MFTLELEINNKIKENTVSNDSIISEFTKELSKTLEIKDMFIYQKPIDNGEFTDENLMKLEEEYKKVITKFLNIQELDDSKIYEVLKIGKSYNVVREYDSEGKETVDLQISNDELPADCKTGMLLRKENNKFVIDKEMTQEMYYKMKEYETKLLNEQEKYLK